MDHLIDGYFDVNAQMTQHRFWCRYGRLHPRKRPISAVSSSGTCVLKWHLTGLIISVPRGDHRSTTTFSYVTAGDPVSCEQSILAFISCLYQCRSSDPGLVFLHLCLVEVFSPRWMTSRGLLSDWTALPPWMQFFWASQCLMITSPVCFSLKASRQIFICFANSLSLSWLLYLLSSVLTLC